MTKRTAFQEFSGRRRDGHWVKGLMPQLDGSRYATGNCAAASEAGRCIRNQHAVRPAYGDPWYPTGASIRRETGDTSGGLTPFQTTGATEREYRIPNDVRIADWDRDLKPWLRKGGSITLLVRYGPIADAGMSGSPGFRENHSLEAVGIEEVAGHETKVLIACPLWDGRRAGIPEGPHWMRLSDVKKATRQLVLGPGRTVGSAYGANAAYCSFGTRTFTPPVAPFVLYRGATKLRKPRVYTPTRKVWMRKSPRLVSTNHIAPVGPGFAFEAYQYIVNGDGKWIGNRTGTAWLFFAAVKFVRYL